MKQLQDELEAGKVVIGKCEEKAKADHKTIQDLEEGQKNSKEVLQKLNAELEKVWVEKTNLETRLGEQVKNSQAAFDKEVKRS